MRVYPPPPHLTLTVATSLSLLSDSWTPLFSSGALLCQADVIQYSAGDFMSDVKTLRSGIETYLKSGGLASGHSSLGLDLLRI